MDGKFIPDDTFLFTRNQSGDDISLIHLFKDGSTEFVYLKDYNNPSFYD